MAYPIRFFDRLFMPLYSPARVAKILGGTSPTEALNMLLSFRPQKTYAVISYWSTKVQVSMLSAMGDYALSVIALMDHERLARAMVHLSMQLVRKLGNKLAINDIRAMTSSWSGDERIIVFAKLPTDVSSVLVKDLPSDERVEMLCRYKPWVASALMSALEPIEKTKVLESMHPVRAFDLFDRLHMTEKISVLHGMEKERRDAIIETLSPKIIAEIFSSWEVDFVAELMSEMEEERQLAVFKRLPKEQELEIFPILPLKNQVSVLKSKEPPESANFVKDLKKAQRDLLLGNLYPDLADAIRKLILIR